jgi:amidophosphoribosyltransferase
MSTVPGGMDFNGLDGPPSQSLEEPLLAETRYGDDRLREECGVFGIFGHEGAAAVTALGLHALQHRGQEGCGIVSFDGQRFNQERRLGLVGDNFNKADVIARLKGSMALGHNRYSTTGDVVLRNVQPLFADLDQGGFAVAHNGNLTNALTLRRELISSGAICQSTSDTEVILHLLSRSKKRRIIDRFTDAIMQIEGAYALVCLLARAIPSAYVHLFSAGSVTLMC